MPRFAKCFNPECFCYGTFQEARGGCPDCGAPLYPIEGNPPRDRPAAAVAEEYMYFVSLTGPSPVVMPIKHAENKDDAAAKALNKLRTMGHEPNQFRVDKVYGPEDSPRFSESV